MIIASQQEKNRRGSLSLLSLEKRGRVMMVSVGDASFSSAWSAGRWKCLMASGRARYNSKHCLRKEWTRRERERGRLFCRYITIQLGGTIRWPIRAGPALQWWWWWWWWNFFGFPPPPPPPPDPTGLYATHSVTIRPNQTSVLLVQRRWLSSIFLWAVLAHGYSTNLFL